MRWRKTGNTSTRLWLSAHFRRMELENLWKIGRTWKITVGGSMARRERPVGPEGSPIEALAYWLRVLRDQAGMTVDRLKQQINFSKSTLYGAFGGTQLPSQQVTLAIVAACKGDVEAWQSYWAQVRLALDRDAPEGVVKAIVPPWAVSAERPVDASRNDSAEVAESSRGAVDHGIEQYEEAGLIESDRTTGEKSVHGHRPRPTWLVAIAGMVAAAVVSATVTALTLDRSGLSSGGNPKLRHSALAVVIVQNKVAIGSSSLLEDSTSEYLSTRPIPRCRLRGCKVKGTDMWSGAVLPVSCWVRGAEMTNEDTTTAGITRNPDGATSTLWYRGIWPNGRSGYLSEVYIQPKYRGGLGLPRCRS